MNIKPVKAYLIDVSERTITDIEIRDWTQISLCIGEECDYFTCPISWANGDTLYADDEGLFHTISGGIVVPDLNQIIVGNVVIMGADMSTGSARDVKFTKEEILKLFYFISAEQAIAYADKVCSNGSTFIIQ
jgi:hypothetical protein